MFGNIGAKDVPGALLCLVNDGIMGGIGDYCLITGGVGNSVTGKACQGGKHGVGHQEDEQDLHDVEAGEPSVVARVLWFAFAAGACCSATVLTPLGDIEVPPWLL